MIAEYEQDFTKNERSPFMRFFHHVLDQNKVHSGEYLPDYNTIVSWMEIAAADYGAIIDPKGDGLSLSMGIKFYDPAAYTLWLLQWTHGE